ncbi:MAG: BMC domain-containing protein [Clostridia bacterium]|nr:BMC domain-containing protein [Clostridia bacterium]
MTANFSIGLIEISGLGDAIKTLDQMCKVAEVEFVATERRLGGRLVTLVVKGEVSAVQASVDAGVELAKTFGTLKAWNVIPSPHTEILPYLHLDADRPVEPKSESAATHVGPARIRKNPTKKAASAAKPAAKRTRTRKTAANK